MIFLIIVYTKFCYNIPSYQALTNRPNLSGLIRLSPSLSGIDKKVIDSFPVFTFSSLKGAKQGLECVVCLSKFEESENFRLLPICRHAFHMNCIDKWLESNSSCPLCRDKLDPYDLTYCKYPLNSSNLIRENSNLEVFVQGEQAHHQISSSRFNLGASFRKFGKKKEEPLIQKGSNNSDDHNENDKKMFHNFKHDIIVSEIVQKSRWSDANSSDLMFLNSEMLNLMSSKRFSQSPLLSMNEDIVKIKEIKEGEMSHLISSFSCGSSNEALSQISSTTSRSINEHGAKRSVSEIVNIPRSMEYVINNNNKVEESLMNNGSDERMRRLWLSIVRKTVQWFAGQEKISSSLESNSRSHSLNV